MPVVLHAIQSVASIVIMIVIGIALARRGWFNEESGKLIANLVSKVSLPCVVLLNITDNFNRGNFFDLVHGLAIPVTSVIISYYVGAFFVWALKVPQGRRSIFKAMFYLANCMYIGLPINIALFGEGSVVYVFEYFAANTVALWGVGVYQMAMEGRGDEAKPKIADSLKKILFSPLLGLIIAVILVLLGIKLPPLLKDTCRYLGSMTTPLSMIFVGLALSRTVLADMKLNLENIAALSGRFIIGPAVVFLLHTFIPAGELEFKVLVIQSATPVAVAIPLLAEVYGLDVKYAAILTSMSTLLFIISVPIYMWILH